MCVIVATAVRDGLPGRSPRRSFSDFGRLRSPGAQDQPGCDCLVVAKMPRGGEDAPLRLAIARLPSLFQWVLVSHGRSSPSSENGALIGLI